MLSIHQHLPCFPSVSTLFADEPDFPSPEGILHLPYVFPTNYRALAIGVKDLLRPILTGIFNRPDFGMWKLCLQQILVPRIHVMVFLENLLLRRPEDHAGIQDKYPGGRSALHQEMRRLKMPTIAAILDQRRFELCFAWHHYGKRSFEEILQALKVSQPGRFKARYERWLVEQNIPVFPGVQSASYSDALLAAHPSFLPSLRGQYWGRREAQEGLARHRQRMETDPDYRILQEHVAMVAANNPEFAELGNPPAPTTLGGEVDDRFWAMRSTGAAMIIAAERLTFFAGLEGCAELLMAA